MPVTAGSPAPDITDAKVPCGGQCNRLVSSTTAANALAASQDVDKCALRLQIGELSCTQC
jgi:hypothetical protein